MVQPHPCINLSKSLTLASSVFVRHNWVAGSGNVEWLFYLGMLFASTEKWWGAGGVRQSPHEGLDFCFFVDAEGDKKQLVATTNIPVLFDGEVAAVFEDFLGKTILVKHEQHLLDEEMFFTIYAHVSPLTHIKTGLRLSAGELLGRVALPAKEHSKVPAHLHLSVALVPKTVDAEMLDWRVLSQQPVILCDPLDILAIKYKRIEDLHPG
jgi:hypothetical protein